MPKHERDPNKPVFHKEHYIVAMGLKCPYCASANITTASPMAPEEPDTIVQEIACLVCRKGWTDVFTLTNVRES